MVTPGSAQAVERPSESRRTPMIRFISTSERSVPRMGTAPPTMPVLAPETVTSPPRDAASSRASATSRSERAKTMRSHDDGP